MRRAVLVVATAVLLGGPTVLAFFAGGYFDGPRAVAAAAAWAIVLLLTLAGSLPLPASRPGRIAVLGLVGLALWSTISVLWAPLVGPAADNVQRLLLYVGVLLASTALLRDARAAKAAEPVLALGALVVIGYGLSGRLLPGVIDLLSDRSYVAGGRLEQPLTYWNAEGLLAALGLILCVRLSGDVARPLALRAAAAAACAPLAMGVFLSYSRGSLAVLAMGLIVLVAATPSRPQLRAVVMGIVAGAVASGCAAALPGVASLEGSASVQQRDGAITLAVLAAVMACTALLASRSVAAERRDAQRLDPIRLAKTMPALAGVAAAICVVGLVAGGFRETRDRLEPAAATPSRFVSVSSVRYEYWRVGFDVFAAEPLRGVGAGNFRVAWRRERRIDRSVNEVHSLELEMLTELGIPGLLLLALFVAGVAAAARRALRGGAPLAAGACAVLSAWLLHASIDWDWQMPAVTLPAIVLAGGLLAAAEARPRPEAIDTEGIARPADREPVRVSV